MGARACLGVGVLALLATAAVASAIPVNSGPEPVLSKWSDWPYQATCWGPEAVFDPLVAFSGPADAENGTSPAEAGLRRVIKEQRDWAEPLAAPHGWRRISESESWAEFTRGRLDGTLEWLALEAKDGGRWSFSSYSSDCDPTTVLGDKAVVTWSLASKQGRLGPDSRTLWINLGAGGCASGEPQNPRAHFRFRALGRRLLMIAWLDPPRSRGGGGFTCEGVYEPPRKVRLPHPLGDYKLFDGATFPPIPAGKTRTRYY
jgi:hypothetical protein